MNVKREAALIKGNESKIIQCAIGMELKAIFNREQIYFIIFRVNIIMRIVCS